MVLREYYAVFDTVNDFDKRLLTIKGWGVTLSLAALERVSSSGITGCFWSELLAALRFGSSKEL